MFQHLLVPLDGSQLAEAVLPVVRYFGQHLHAQVTLLHVVERDAPPLVHGERHLCDPAEASRYLGDVMQSLQAAGLTVQCHVHEVAVGNVAYAIVRHAEQELANDLILLSTHGRSGVKGMLFGSIAQQVLGSGTRPVLVVHPDAAPAEFACRRVMVPLDGTARHEHSLPVAAELAGAFGAALHLVTVVPRAADLGWEQGPSRRLLPRATEAQLDLVEQNAVAYLDRMRRELVAKNAVPGPVTAQVRRGDPATELVQALQESQPDLAVVATHALKGWEAFWAGSVTPRILSQWRRPVLLVRAT